MSLTSGATGLTRVVVAGAAAAALESGLVMGRGQRIIIAGRMQPTELRAGICFWVMVTQMVQVSLCTLMTVMAADFV
jgi:hypothetical protein